jgi:hypothetical protein
MTTSVPRHSTFVWQKFAVLAAMLVATGVVVSIVTNDSHYLNRFGALVAAIGAVLVVVQIRFDIAIEREFQLLLRRIDEEDESLRSPVLGQVANRLKEQSKLRAHEDVKTSRTSAAIIVAVITAGGEVLHGWGEEIIHGIKALLF